MDKIDKTRDAEEVEVGILDLLIIVAKQKKFVAITTASAALFSVLLALLLPNIYVGTSTLLPPQKDQANTAALIGQLVGAGAGGGGIASALGLKNPNDLYVGVLRSRTIADRIVERFKLQELYDQDTLVDTRKELDSNTTVTAGKDGLIKVEFEDRDPKRAAEIANAYIEELEKLTSNLAISEASQRRLYFDKQVAQTKTALTQADIALKNVQESSGLIRPDEQAKAIFEAVAALRGRISAKEVEIFAMSTFATAGNPDYARAKKELDGLKKQLAGIQSDNKLGDGDILVPTGKVPGAALEFLTRYRDVKYHETLYELLAKQVELARIDEGRSSLLIQFVDRATPPDKKSKPKRAVIVIAITLSALILAMLAAVLREAFWARADTRNRWLELCNHLRLR